jgi:signal transduction histidine kinase/FixJ family two-component response regulator
MKTNNMTKRILIPLGLTLLVLTTISIVKSVLKQTEVYNLMIIQYIMQAKYDEAIQAGCQALRLLGIEIPLDSLSAALSIELAEVQDYFSNQTFASLIDKPDMIMPEQKMAMKLLMSIESAAFFSNKALYDWISVKAVNLSLQYGNTPDASKAYSNYGLFLASTQEAYQAGYEFGLLAVKLSQKYNSLVYQCRTNQFLNFLSPWVKHINATIPINDEAYKTGLEVGELEYVGYTLNHRLQHSFYQGNHLEQVLAEAQRFLPFSQKSQNHWVTDMMLACQLPVLNLQGQSAVPVSDKMDEAQYLEVCYQHQILAAIAVYQIRQSLVFYLYEQPTVALQCILQASKHVAFIQGLIPTAEYHFYYSLILAALYPESDLASQKQYWQQLLTHQKQMKIWANNCPENFLHKYLLVEAEMARLAGHLIEAMDLYDRAIASAKDNGFIQIVALGNELAAQFWLANSKEEFAKSYLKKAHYYYQQWGALAIVTNLETRYPQFLASKTVRAIPTNATISATRMASTSTKSGSGWLDLNSIMKAAQTLSEEIVLSRLLEKMMHIVIENAGAEKGFLLLPKQDNWFIEAEGQVDSDDVTVLQSFPLENQAIAENIIHYVGRTQENVVLHDATQESAYQHDQYIIKHRPKSVLCAPLLNQGLLTGILYLENNLTTGAFTSERLEILNLLSAQIAISIEHAKLYHNLEQQVEERTQALKQENFERQQTEANLVKTNQLLETILDTTHTMVAYLDPQFNFIRVNQAYAQADKHEPAFFPGKNHFDLYPNAENEAIFRRVRDTSEPFFILAKPFEFPEHPDMGTTYWDWSLIPTKDPSGTVTGLVFTLINVTERQLAENALQQAKEKAETANQAKSTFLSSMSHELRTPLNGILGFAQILQRDTSITTQQQHGLNVIEQSGNHLLALINDILDLAKVESGKIELYETDFNLPSLLSGVSELIKIKTKDKSINFYLESANDLPNGVHGDELRLRQILLNLLGNAIKFTDRGSVTLKVSVNEDEHFNESNRLPLRMISFRIEDTGVGISKENLESIFEPFEQVGDQKRKAKGTGLGLAISKKLVKLMGGQLRVSSQLNIGTQFWFELALPVVDYNVAKVGAQQPIIGVKGESSKILVVDDNLENQAVLVDLLSPLGFNIEQANDGREGLEKAILWQPDVIITDLVMPEMDGFELVRQLRQSPILKEKIIIVTSASSYKEDKQKSLAVGSDAFLPKPIQVETLFEQLQHHLNLTWLYGKSKKEAAEENHATLLVFPPVVELERLIELSLMGDIDELEEQSAILAESDVKLKPFVTQVQAFLKKYQVDELCEWLLGEMTNDSDTG